ncbi:hypothetical protein [Marinobacterium zhoushanense]|nr:hypothetical protein [Marinobacterium zhoushanense]
MMSSQPIILCANQRSGTTALGQALESQKRVTSFAEIFMTSEYHVTEIPSNYFYWMSKYRKKNIGFYRRGEVTRYIGEYFDYLSKLSGTDYFLVDIKYDQWSYVVGESNNIFYPPVLLSYFINRGYPIVHLIRDNLFEQYLSIKYANAVGESHYRKGEYSDSKTDIGLYVDVEECNYFIGALSKNVNLFKEFLKGYNQSVELHYDECFLNNCVTNYAKEKLSSVIPDSEWMTKVETPLVKTPVDIMKKISNSKEVVSYFSNSDYHWMFENLSNI